MKTTYEVRKEIQDKLYANYLDLLVEMYPYRSVSSRLITYLLTIRPKYQELGGHDPVTNALRTRIAYDLRSF